MDEVLEAASISLLCGYGKVTLTSEKLWSEKASSTSSDFAARGSFGVNNPTRIGGGVSSLDIQGSSGEEGLRVRAGGVSHSSKVRQSGGVNGGGSEEGTRGSSSSRRSA